ncbi:fasciclin-3-like [Ctenocephalides felis]|uniref:fasciclin-3-like n=1 Tax=Ctenocephalides felis TaxID=7515 RepID=UPI000E6E114B|nr:fasciclin-3-like [Ctenocephalides felis]
MDRDPMTLNVLAVLCDAQAPVEIYPQNPVVLEGQNLTMLCRVGVDVHYCRITIPGLKNSLNLKSGQRVGGYEYYGAGLEQGQCGVHIGSVTAKEAGEFKCSMGTSPIESDASTTIIVAREPSPPEMETSPGTQARDTFRANDILTARCVVRDGRPPANISWYLDDEPIYDGLSEPQVIDTPDGLATSVQNITRRLQPNDDGRRLTCVARHLAYRKPNQASVIHHIIKVQYEPLPRERPIGIFGVTLGELAYINVTIEANPRPVLEWTVNGESIPEGSIDSTQRFEVTSAQPLGQNRYNATLRISDLTLEDTTKEYRLRARNEIGMTEYEIRISSSEPPMGGVLDLGSIVGIVVALAIVLIVVILIIFARATGRWCFHGGSLNTDLSKNVVDGMDSEAQINVNDNSNETDEYTKQQVEDYRDHHKISNGKDKDGKKTNTPV